MSQRRGLLHYSGQHIGNDTGAPIHFLLKFLRLEEGMLGDAGDVGRFRRDE
jgi:hypothetical protein